MHESLPSLVSMYEQLKFQNLPADDTPKSSTREGDLFTHPSPLRNSGALRPAVVRPALEMGGRYFVDRRKVRPPLICKKCHISMHTILNNAKERLGSLKPSVKARITYIVYWTDDSSNCKKFEVLFIYFIMTMHVTHLFNS